MYTEFANLNHRSNYCSSAIERFTGRIRFLAAVEIESKYILILVNRHSLVISFLTFLELLHNHQSIDSFRAIIQTVVLSWSSLLPSDPAGIIGQKRKANIVKSMMAGLPKERLTYRPASITTCGFDYFGPFFVKKWNALKPTTYEHDIMPSQYRSSI